MGSKEENPPARVGVTGRGFTAIHSALIPSLHQREDFLTLIRKEKGLGVGGGPEIMIFKGRKSFHKRGPRRTPFTLMTGNSWGPLHCLSWDKESSSWKMHCLMICYLLKTMFNYLTKNEYILLNVPTVRITGIPHFIALCFTAFHRYCDFY